MSLPSNYIARPYRGVSVRMWPTFLERTEVLATLRGQEAYRRTEFIVLRGDAGSTALVRVERVDDEPLMSPIKRVQWLAGPEDCQYIKSGETDTGNATAMASAASEGEPGRLVYVIEGMYHHVNFIFDPRPLTVTVVDVIPPDPPKLLTMAQRVLAFDEGLPPIKLEFEVIDIRDLAADHDAQWFLLPCRGSGVDLPAPVAFLDERPTPQDWRLIGCERSRQLYEWFYDREPSHRVELCPRLLSASGGPALVKCCLIERGVEREDDRVVVPWGSSLEEVREALRLLVRDQLVRSLQIDA